METLFEKEQNKQHVQRPNTTNVQTFAYPLPPLVGLMDPNRF